jgi:hypothetical protein
MKKVIVPILVVLVAAILVVGGVLVLKGKKPTSQGIFPGHPSSQVNRFQGEVNVCELFPKEKISQFLGGKEITETLSQPSTYLTGCGYYFREPQLRLYLFLHRYFDINKPINNWINHWKSLGGIVKEEKQIPLKNFVSYNREGKIGYIDLVIDEKTFLDIGIDGFWLSNDEGLSFASKLADYLKSEFGVKYLNKF